MIYLLGNKSDDEINRAVSKEEGQDIADKNGFTFFEVSAKENINI